MPWSSVKSAKKAGALVRYLKKAVSLAAINKLYDIYDSIKGQGTADNPFAVAVASWKGLVTLKNGRIWVLKKKKKSEQYTQGQGEVEVPWPTGISGIGDGTLESFKDALGDELKRVLGTGDRYVYVVATYKSKVIAHVEDSKATSSDYYELPYKVTKTGIEFGSPVRVKRVTNFQKAEQWRQFRKGVGGFVRGEADLGEVVDLGMKMRRQIVCRPKS